MAMAKAKVKGKGKKQAPQRDHHARVSFLYNAAKLNAESNPVLARVYAQTVKQVARKNVLRLPSHIKRSICKKCSSMLAENVTSVSRVVNESKEKKPHCDVLVIDCTECGQKKRYPIGKDPKFDLFAKPETTE